MLILTKSLESINLIEQAQKHRDICILRKNGEYMITDGSIARIMHDGWQYLYRLHVQGGAVVYEQRDETGRKTKSVERIPLNNKIVGGATIDLVGLDAPADTIKRLIDRQLGGLTGTLPDTKPAASEAVYNRALRRQLEYYK